MVKINKKNFSFRGNLTPINKSKVTRIVQHHMAHKSWGIDDVHNYHKNSNGWAGIGYNYWVDFKGNIYEGRGMNVGAHVAGYNSTTIGVGFQGDFTSQTMPDAQLKAGIAINKWIMSQLPKKVSIVGHKDLASTSCPGKNFRMNDLRKGISGGSVKPAKPSKPSSKPSKPKPSKSNWKAVAGNWTGQTLKEWDYGKAVGDMQKKLANSNPPFYPNKGAKNNGIDNYYGKDTKNAVTRYQKYYGLSMIDGMAGREVYNHVNGGKKASKPSAPKKPANKTKYPLPTGVLKRGSRGEKVKQLQRALNAANFKVAVDGIYGKDVANAVGRFQSVHDAYNVDKVYGNRTRVRLNKLINK